MPPGGGTCSLIKLIRADLSQSANTEFSSGFHRNAENVSEGLLNSLGNGPEFAQDQKDGRRRTMQIHRVPAFQDNYIFVLHDADSRQAAVVDPGDAGPVLACLDRLGATLTAIFNTHHHHDHVGGNRQLLVRFPQAVVYGGVEDRGRIPGQTVFLNAGDEVTFAGRQGQIYFVPGHTRAHIAYYFKPTPGETWGDLFCGDTLFAGGAVVCLKAPRNK
jgi:glyoxylase-like metal-dependent hydrolase (beta-lactamase superfamily II)